MLISFLQNYGIHCEKHQSIVRTWTILLVRDKNLYFSKCLSFKRSMKSARYSPHSKVTAPVAAQTSAARRVCAPRLTERRNRRTTSVEWRQRRCCARFSRRGSDTMMRYPKSSRAARIPGRESRDDNEDVNHARWVPGSVVSVQTRGST